MPSVGNCKPLLKLDQTSTNEEITEHDNNIVGEFPMGVGHRVENRWGLTKAAVVLLNMVKNDTGCPKKNVV